MMFQPTMVWLRHSMTISETKRAAPRGAALWSSEFPKRRLWPLFMCGSVHAHRFEIVRTHGGEGGFAVGDDCELRSIGRMDRERRLAVLHDRLYVGHLVQHRRLPFGLRQGFEALFCRHHGCDPFLVHDPLQAGPLSAERSM